MIQKQQKSGGQRKHGRCLRKQSKMNYKAHGRRRTNKLRRIRRSNGERAAKAYRVDAKANFPARKGKGRKNSLGRVHRKADGVWTWVQA
jgi:hypothetical protein